MAKSIAGYADARDDRRESARVRREVNVVKG
jgi:hypothetical protein